MAVSSKKKCANIVVNDPLFIVMYLDSNKSDSSITHGISKQPTPAAPQYSDSVWYPSGYFLEATLDSVALSIFWTSGPDMRGSHTRKGI